MNDTSTNYETISNYCLGKASSFDNNDEHCNKSSLQALQVINKSNSFSSSSSSAATTVPNKRKIFDNKYVSSSFVDKENALPNFKAANNSKKKKIFSGLGGDGKPPMKDNNTTISKPLSKDKEEQIATLQTQLKQASTALTKVQTISISKDKELNELSFKLDRQIDETNLYKVMADQTGLFELLNNQDTLIENLMRLIGEKDQVSLNVRVCEFLGIFRILLGFISLYNLYLTPVHINIPCTRPLMMPFSTTAKTTKQTKSYYSTQNPSMPTSYKSLQMKIMNKWIHYTLYYHYNYEKSMCLKNKLC